MRKRRSEKALNSRFAKAFAFLFTDAGTGAEAAWNGWRFHSREKCLALCSAATNTAHSGLLLLYRRAVRGQGFDELMLLLSDPS